MLQQRQVLNALAETGLKLSGSGYDICFPFGCFQSPFPRGTEFQLLHPNREICFVTSFVEDSELV